MNMREDIHRRLWGAYWRWRSLRDKGITRFDLKVRGLHQHGNPNKTTAHLIFMHGKLPLYEAVVREFDRFSTQDARVHGIQDMRKKQFKAFMNDAIARIVPPEKLMFYCEALQKWRALTGQTDSFAGIAKYFRKKIRRIAGSEVA